MEILSFIIPFIVLLTVVVFIHEYGHYYFAKLYGVGVTDFSIGFGKEIFGFNDKSGTRWKFCAIPLGGYVKFFGDRNVFSQAEQEELLKQYSKKDQNKLFVTKPIYQRSLVVAAGPLANFILAILIFTFIYMFAGKDFTPAQIQEVQKDSPAYVSGIKSGDVILSINKNKVTSILEVSNFINTSTSNIIDVKVLRNNEEIILPVTPKITAGKDSLGNNINKKIIGIKIAPLNNEFNRERLGPAKALFYAIKETWFVTQASLDFVISMFKGKGDTTQLGGPIKIAKITGQVAQHGLIAFLSIMAYISISLGFINLFPIPMLDGGHLMFYAFEKILGRPLTQRTQEGFFRIGLFLLISLMFFTTFNDLKDLGLF
ncbi:RIP metalloprotease RseP [Pelagibacteraceae bacterium]|jgi:regulator of sigma E protease|nr:RIP metalloprotease RseP [Pelagibacteraceae bacterium]